jgi:hypothetical protein
VNRNSATRFELAALTAAMLAGAGLMAGCARGPAAVALQAPTALKTATAARAASPNPGKMPAAAVLRGTIAALRSGGSVRVDLTTVTPQGTWTATDDSAAAGGRQAWTTPGGGRTTILLIAGVGYIQGNALGLAEAFGVSQDEAEQYAGQWISLKHGQKIGQGEYADVTAGISLPSIAASMAMAAPAKLAQPGKVNGQATVAVQGKLTDKLLPSGTRGTAYAADNATLRPRQFNITEPGHIKTRYNFSKWHEKVHLTAPKGAIPATVLTSAKSS